MKPPRPEYDRLLKIAAEDDPKGLLEVFGILPPTADAVVKSLPREIITPLREADQLCHVESGRERWMVLIEFLVRYRPLVAERLLYYAMAANARHKLPIDVLLVLLDPSQAPRKILDQRVLRARGLTVRLIFTVIRFWELDAARLLTHPRLLPLTLLAHATERDREEAAARIVELGNRELASEFIVLGSKRYDKAYLVELLRRHHMPIPIEFFEDTWLWKEATEKGAQKGRKQLLSRLLRSKFAGLDALSELNRISGSDVESIFDLAVSSNDRLEVEQAIIAAAKRTT